MNGKQVIVGIAFILAAIFLWRVEGAGTLTSTTASSVILNSVFFKYLYQYWKIEVIIGFVAGIIFFIKGLS